MMDDEPAEGKLYATFEKHEEFRNLQETLLVANLSVHPTAEEDRHEASLLLKLTNILAEYQEQAYLLDPFFESLVVPVVNSFKAHAKVAVLDSNSRGSPARVERIALLLYGYITCRGHKTIIRFFPHEVADLSIALEYMLLSDGLCQEPSQWALRYIVLLWLALICMIPFDLAQFDPAERAGKTARDLETMAKGFLGKAGLEREGAATLLSRLYTRQDTRSGFRNFLELFHSQLQGNIDVFSTIGSLRVICEVLKSGPVEEVLQAMPLILHIQEAVENGSAHTTNAVMRKLKVKMISRLALRALPPRAKAHRKGRTLKSDPDAPPEVTDVDNDIDVCEEVEFVLEELFPALQDRDTIVRWSAAKGVARISERLTSEFAEQVVDTVMDLFAVHFVPLSHMPAAAESTWHGSCLACAEIARRGLVSPAKLPKLIEWMEKALQFDIRKGAHSIGSNVRDAAAYVIWAIARAQDRSALIPYANSVSRRLVTVALFDREVHIRRAASAAFQEHVGRMNLFPHGIDVLRKTDFYAVSVRRNAFLIAAPEVAEHTEYRDALLDHLLGVTQRHWDASMRQLGAESLGFICRIDLSRLGPMTVKKALQLLDTLDTTDMHGGLLVLGELAALFKEEKQGDFEPNRREVFESLSRIPLDVVKSPRHELVTAAACRLIARAISLVEIESENVTPVWRQILDYGLRHRNEMVQESASMAMASLSRLSDCSLKRELSVGSPTVQQSLGRFLGALDYSSHSHDLPDTLTFLLRCVRPSPSRLSNVEARRNCFAAIPQIVSSVTPRITDSLSANVVRDLLDALREGLGDYTIDERGDVGSWIRVVCVKGLSSIATTLFAKTSDIPNLQEYLPPPEYHDIVGEILKQGVERLDNVRQVSGESFLTLLQHPLPSIESGYLWRMEGEALLRSLFLSEGEIVGWHNGDWLYPRAVRLLEIEVYRKQVLSGIVQSIGSRTDSTQRTVTSSFVSYARSLPLTRESGYDLCQLVNGLLDYAESHMNSNVVVVPVLQTFNALLIADVLTHLPDLDAGLKSLHSLLRMSSRHIDRVRNVQRVHESMRIVVNLLAFPDLFENCVSILDQFLAHQYPKIRSDAAEYLYLVLQSKDIGRETDEVENLLLETEWSSSSFSPAAARLIDAMLGKRVG